MGGFGEPGRARHQGFTGAPDLPITLGVGGCPVWMTPVACGMAGGWVRRASVSTMRWGSLLCAWLLAVPCALAAPARLAVFELRNEAGARDSEVAYLTDRLRALAREQLPGDMVILTRESLQESIPRDVRLEECDADSDRP